MSTKTKAKPAEPSVAPEQPSTAEEVVNEPKIVKAFGKKYEVKRFTIGQFIRVMPYLAPLGYLLRSVGQGDTALLAVQALQHAGEPALGVLSVAISEPIEWIEEQDDPIGGLELLTEVVDKNARYFFEPANVERLKTVRDRFQLISQRSGGDTLTP